MKAKLVITLFAAAFVFFAVCGEDETLKPVTGEIPPDRRTGGYVFENLKMEDVAECTVNTEFYGSLPYKRYLPPQKIEDLIEALRKIKLGEEVDYTTDEFMDLFGEETVHGAAQFTITLKDNRDVSVFEIGEKYLAFRISKDENDESDVYFMMLKRD